VGEWSRARDAIHAATTDEARSEAIDRLWGMARASHRDEVFELLEDIRTNLTHPTRADHRLLDWITREIGAL
ncbi:MAG: hypothetical protein HUU03_12255, partial [Planctomycetaceae bacterium]|nr:hypothetical protein [Planctomycetaceae bacterium]